MPDILKIIEHYFDFNFDEIVEFHNDIIPEKDDIDKFILAAEVIGRQAGVYLNKSNRLAKKIYEILETNLKNESESVIAIEWARKKGWEIEYAFTILKALQCGLIKST